MRILVTNDDGYEAKGLLTLVGILRKYGEVTVVAPKRPQSGMSMAVTMGFKPIAVRHLPEREGADWWYLDGTPASCIKFGIDNVLAPARPDLVVSGINHGSNAATAAIYSGTIGAAMEGAVNGIPALGVSLDTFNPDADFSGVEAFLPKILDQLLPQMQGRYGLFYNINFPDRPAGEIRGVRLTRMGYAHWEHEYQDYGPFLQKLGRVPSEEDCRYIAHLEPDEELYVMAGDFTDNGGNPADADHLLLDRGYVTITPQNIDNTATAELERLCVTI
ncbi:5'-nucleotidase /3'-nucleotidase /exopolyphosphatase [Bacteroidales bacterium WCE2004]|nr:5'-nucleotidase /3'-nucleotidase /exopolyphosphatase [Bacteroidales bacterium WCE2004]